MNTYFYGQIIHDKGERIYNVGKTVYLISIKYKYGYMQNKMYLHHTDCRTTDIFFIQIC